ncbi:MAG: TIR domain-containing protein [bacterium]|nr:TIR domain-containing protein [bacterium]
MSEEQEQPPTGWETEYDITEFEGSVLSAAWSPSGKQLATWSYDLWVRVWMHPPYDREPDLRHRHLDSTPDVFIAWCEESALSLCSLLEDRQDLDLADGSVTGVSAQQRPPFVELAGGGRIIVDGAAVLVQPAIGPRTELGHHDGQVMCLAVDAHGSEAYSGGVDGTLRVWSLAGSERRRFEYSEAVTGVAACPFGPLIAITAREMGTDGRLTLLRTDSWDTVLDVPARSFNSYCWSLAFHPTEPLLAYPVDKGLRIVRYDLDVLLGPRRTQARRWYRNAKVVLVGDTGVGKSALADALRGAPFVPKESTHTRSVWTLDREDVALQGEVTEERETLLWDLAGQAGYRVFHQQHLHDASVGLVLFDSRSDTDPFAGVGYWARALDQAVGKQPFAKILVTARADRGRTTASDAAIAAMVERFGFEQHYVTSAKEGAGTGELARALREAIAWDRLPVIEAPEVLAALKRYVVECKSAAEMVLTRRDALLSGFRASGPLGAEASAGVLDRCVDRLETAGLVRSLAFGRLVLLQPELLDSYGSWLAQAARNQKQGMGFLAEEEAREGRFRMDTDRALAGSGDEELLLAATVEDLLRRGIAIRQNTDEGPKLVFPSELRSDMPAYPGGLAQALLIRFEGPVAGLYATLVVRLMHSPGFTNVGLHRNAAKFTDEAGHECALALDYPDRSNDALGRITIFADGELGRASKLTFVRFVRRHVEGGAFGARVQVSRVYECHVPITEQTVRLRQEHGFDTVLCPVCGDELPMDDLEAASAETDDSVQYEEEVTESELARQGRLTSLAEKQKRGEHDVFVSFSSPDRGLARELTERLLSHGVLPWFDERDLAPGQRVAPELQAALAQVRAVVVMLGSSGVGRWQDLELGTALERSLEPSDADGTAMPLIPVVVSGGPDVEDWPLFLRAYSGVDLRQAEDEAPMRRLVKAILEARHGQG